MTYWIPESGCLEYCVDVYVVCNGLFVVVCNCSVLVLCLWSCVCYVCCADVIFIRFCAVIVYIYYVFVGFLCVLVGAVRWD